MSLQNIQEFRVTMTISVQGHGFVTLAIDYANSNCQSSVH